MTALRLFSKILNIFLYLGYPLLLPSYVLGYLLFIDSDFIIGKTIKAKTYIWISECLNLTLFPLLTLFFLKTFGFLKTLFPPEKKDRILPYFSSMIFYFWAYYVHKNQAANIPLFNTKLILTWALCLLLSLLLNQYYKISISIIVIFSVAFLSGWEILWGQDFSISLFVYSIIACGMVTSLRLYADTHTKQEINLSFIVGIIAVLISEFWMA